MNTLADLGAAGGCQLAILPIEVFLEWEYKQDTSHPSLASHRSSSFGILSSPPKEIAHPLAVAPPDLPLHHSYPTDTFFKT